MTRGNGRGSSRQRGASAGGKKARRAGAEAPVAVILERDFIEEMEDSYLEYSMSVIVSRALPDARDGLKPVQRRILWAMQESGMRADGSHRKCAKVVGDVMGSYHPHGDQSIYETLVRMGQPFATYVPLIDAQGNFGSPGFPPAAMRYTECRPSMTAARMVQDINEDTVDFSVNYDGSEQEPDVLPSVFPNLLINGASGIAVGMATNIPPHNPVETLNATLLLLDEPDATLGRLMRKLKGPDFPSGCDIIGREGVKEAYQTGSGKFTLRARSKIEALGRGASRIILTNLPPAVSVSQICGQIVTQVERGRLGSVSRVEDASDKNGQELHVNVKKGYDPETVLQELFKYTKLEDTCSVHMRALVDGIPRVLGVSALLRIFCDHRLEVVLRRSLHRRDKAQARRHIITALLKALDAIDEVIALIRSSESAEAARLELCDFLEIDREQAQAILDMRLRRLVQLERDALQAEADELDTLIATLTQIIEDEKTRRAAVREELTALRDLWKKEKRRSLLRDEDAPTSGQGMLPLVSTGSTGKDGMGEKAEVEDAPVHAQVLRGGWVEVTSQASSGRGNATTSRAGADVSATEESQDWQGGDPGRALFYSGELPTQDRLLFVTEDGRSFAVAMSDVPEGTNILLSDLCAASRQAALVAVFPVPAEDDTQDVPPLFLATSDGKLKRLLFSEAVPSRRDGLSLIRLDAGAQLVGCAPVTEKMALLLLSSHGHATRVPVNEFPVQGRGSSGVKGMELPEGAAVKFAAPTVDKDVIFVGTERGWAKGVKAKDIPVRGRGGKGVMIYKPTTTKGLVVAGMISKTGAYVYVVDGAHKAHEVKVTVSSLTGNGTHVTENVLDVFAPLQRR